ncbi:NUDIX domain-containing protein [Candidatus Saccharibacteria bacterium]|nr:NUDIX domain-containing protein [Candidatus Saccharibacteria bacterium]
MKNETYEYPLTSEEFRTIYSKVPRLTVEIIVKSEKGILLTLRDIEPYKGMWHLPGGTVHFDERLPDAVVRVAKKELGINVMSSKFVDYIEYPTHLQHSFDSPVGMAFLVEYDGEIKTDRQASEAQWFLEAPANIVTEQSAFIKKLL